MTDVLFLAALTAFFALAVLFVRGCEHIIGPDLEANVTSETAEPEPAPDRIAGMSGTESIVGLVLSALVTAYLVYALLFPEKL